ncbi:hypothetical protein [Streptomyces sp. MNP-20]|uniref:hypothetical protein n=1 Tax=Streptomyces sp. MNP-20 TaxID=2721165 RepID=UPI0015550E9D|nr:hypothetical protein [Streptomyces sp. MNP-20]
MLAFLDLALKQAAHSPCRYRVGAVLAKGSRVLAHAHNRHRNAPSVDLRHATFHAEEILMRRAGSPRGCVVYVARLDRSGAPALARPCPRCQHALASRGIGIAHYTTSHGPDWLRLA